MNKVNPILTAGSTKTGTKLIALPNFAEDKPTHYIVFRDSPRRKLCVINNDGSVDFTYRNVEATYLKVKATDVKNVITIIAKINKAQLF